MAYTVNEIIDQAVERSNLNDETLFSATEVYTYISSFERRVYLIAAKENPDFFGREGSSAVRASSTDNWDLSATPGNVGAVSKIEIATLVGAPAGLSVGDEVNIVSIRDPNTALAPRIYLRDRTAYEYNSELGDSGAAYVSKLKVYYSFLPPKRTTGTESLDLPDEFASLVVLPLARVMAVRDQRADEVGPIDQEFQLDLMNFLEQVSVFDEGTIRSLDQIVASAGGNTMRLTGDGS